MPIAAILYWDIPLQKVPADGLDLDVQLANATFLLVPQAGHEVWGSGSCAAQIGQDFLRDPNGDLDLSCLAQRQYRFSLPGDPLESK